MKVALFTAAVLIFQAITYFGSELIEGEPHNVERPADSKIPLVPWTGIIYLTWFPLTALTPTILYYTDIKVFAIYMCAWIFDVIFSTATYLIYPTGFSRPATDSRLLKLIYTGSFRHINCSPSMHCSVSFLVIVSCVCADNMNILLAGIMISDALAICASTLSTKQHVITDIVTAVPYAAVSWFVGTVLAGDRIGTLILNLP